MPRGFLVKRNRKPCSSYRIPCEDNGSAQTLPIAMDELAPYSSAMATSGLSDPEKQPQAPHEDPPIKAGGGPWDNLPYSPVQPVGLEMKKTFFKRYLSSPATAESFPVTAAFSSMEKLISQHHHPFITPESKFHANPCPRSSKVPSKKHKASRKLHFTDEVTTSPVLGLKIKAEEPEINPRTPLVKRPPLGEFICQLCKEQYPDPFALAQHKCSRIVRVEYRCPERWHKPRGNEVVKKASMPGEGKENSNGRHAAMMEQSSRVQHQQSVDSSSITNPSSSFLEDNHSPEDGTEEEAFHCPYCHKRFRRHAYLRKHLLTHQPYSPMERGQLTYPCALCGVHFPSMDIRDKHRLWHAVREELLLPLEEALVAEGGQQIFPCELCPTAFFSSPGLALHMNKCHSADRAQDLPAQIPLGPGR
uniref:C2H2-type domain-containing protein n=1 Tax=Pyxicephalus adspersus TaxID=30357 RepID=A0AAV2ZRA2_PYXAD|nr:TPA: hypothetical protein GDO54_005259 [Pyxicephalus adspersus]